MPKSIVVVINECYECPYMDLLFGSYKCELTRNPVSGDELPGDCPLEDQHDRQEV